MSSREPRRVECLRCRSGAPFANSYLCNELRLKAAALLHCFSSERETATCIRWLRQIIVGAFRGPNAFELALDTLLASAFFESIANFAAENQLTSVVVARQQGIKAAISGNARTYTVKRNWFSNGSVASTMGEAQRTAGSIEIIADFAYRGLRKCLPQRLEGFSDASWEGNIPRTYHALESNRPTQSTDFVKTARCCCT